MQNFFQQSDSGGKVNIFGGNRISHCKKNIMNMCLILNGY